MTEGEPKMGGGEKLKDPFTGLFDSVQEFSDALEASPEEVCVNNPVPLCEKNGNSIVSCVGSDGKFYVLLIKNGKVRYLEACGSYPEAKGVGSVEKYRLDL